MLRSGLIAAPLRLGPAALGRLTAFATASRDLRAGVVQGPFWYVGGIGVEPERQGEGIGTALMDELGALAGDPLCLETASERNVAWYERLGFAVIAEGRVPDGPTIWSMKRPSRLQGLMLPKRFPDRAEIAVVRAEAEQLAAGERGRDQAPHRRPRARAPRDGEARLPRPRRPQRPHPAPLPGRAHRRGRRPPRRHRRRDRLSGPVAGAASRRLAVDALEVLAKIRAPLPDTFHGLTDVEQRYRKRYLDLLMNEDTRRLFLTRAKIVTAVRRALDDDGFVEVETPILQPRYGGAFAAPVRDPQQRARPGRVPADRVRAVPQAADRRRARARLRDRQGLPQREHLVQAQPRVHDAGVVRGICRLQGHDAADRESRRARHPRGDRRHRRSRSGATRST